MRLTAETAKNIESGHDSDQGPFVIDHEKPVNIPGKQLLHNSHDGRVLFYGEDGRRPASLMTGAALVALSVGTAAARWIFSVWPIDTGFGAMMSSAVCAQRTRRCNLCAFQILFIVVI
ncbi:MAG TPA: hypothetical protein VKU82_12105 [Planctomycetaceae bacterium]|nr:hypothetical protein [Planctomycetaceae bacterium]